jgi:hypothetical protein
MIYVTDTFEFSDIDIELCELIFRIIILNAFYDTRAKFQVHAAVLKLFYKIVFQ